MDKNLIFTLENLDNKKLPGLSEVDKCNKLGAPVTSRDVYSVALMFLKYPARNIVLQNPSTASECNCKILKALGI